MIWFSAIVLFRDPTIVTPLPPLLKILFRNTEAEPPIVFDDEPGPRKIPPNRLPRLPWPLVPLKVVPRYAWNTTLSWDVPANSIPNRPFAEIVTWGSTDGLNPPMALLWAFPENLMPSPRFGIGDWIEVFVPTAVSTT